MRPGRRPVLAALAVLVACGSPTGTDDGDPDPDPPTPGAYALEPVAEGLSAPLLATAPPGDPRLFVVEQPGRIRLVVDGNLRPTPYLDLTARVGSGGERGLLGLAFDPDFASTGRLWVMYTDRSGASTVEEFRDVPGTDRADPASGQVYLSLAQPFANHNGGHLAFGPDGYLYVGLGDGGSGGDPLGSGQDLGTLLGAILRVDPRGSAGPPWTVPGSNPFVDTPGARPEIWHHGLRNPWRFSFDVVDGRMWIGDVGQSRWEEIDVVAVSEAGVNFGWNVMEGPDCYGASSCDRSGFREPAYAYDHDDGCSVTGGYVYRGGALDELDGWYVFSDYCSGWLRAIRLQTDGRARDPVELIEDAGRVTSLGEDADGELYVVVQAGAVYRLVAGG